MDSVNSTTSVNETSNLVQVDLSDLEHGLKHVCEIFVNFFLYEQLTFPVPKFHEVCWHWLTDLNRYRVVFALPRGHAKTTLAKLAVVWYFLFTPVRFIVYASNTAPIAKDAVRDIIAFIESDNFAAVFGRVQFFKRSEGDGIYIFQIRKKICILRSLGAGQQIRGLNMSNQRPQVFVVDDLEDEENTATDAQRQKLKNWVYGPFLKALDKSWNKVIWLGNMISEDCLLNSLINSKYWDSMLYGCLLSDGKPLWNDLWPIEAIVKDFLEYKEQHLTHVWFAEMMNLPTAAGSGLVQPEEIKFHPRRFPPDLEAGCITIDPAGGNADGDDTAIVVHGVVNGEPEQIDYEFGKFNPTKTAEVAIELCYKWGINVIGIENIAYQRALEDVFKLLFILNGIMNIEIVLLRGNDTNKTIRLQAFWSMNIQEQYAICETAIDVVQQAVTYNVTKKNNRDDLIDAVAYGPQMMQEYLPLMLLHKTVFKAPTAQYGAQVYSV